MHQENKIQFLIKFGQKKYLEKLLMEGEIYAAPIKTFKKEGEHLRLDKFEGVKDLMHLNQNCKIELKMPESNIWKKLPIQKGLYNSSHDDSTCHNYSLFSISEKEARESEFFTIPQEMLTYGDHYVLITNPNAFLKKLVEKLIEKRLRYRYGTIEYYDEGEDQKDLTFFHKRKRHAFEREFRLLIESSSEDPMVLHLGNIKRIASLHSVKEFNGFRFIWPDTT